LVVCRLAIFITKNGTIAIIANNRFTLTNTPNKVIENNAGFIITPDINPYKTPITAATSIKMSAYFIPEI